MLHRECYRLFPDEMFADLFTDVGRRSVPPMIVAVVMVLQRIEGCSDREAVDRFCFDARWKYAAGVSSTGFDGGFELPRSRLLGEGGALSDTEHRLNSLTSCDAEIRLADYLLGLPGTWRGQVATAVTPTRRRSQPFR